MALILFTLEFHLFINKNVLTKDEIESGWISTNRAQLSFSFYILIISICLLCVNIGLIYLTVRFKRSRADIKNIYETNMNLINGDNGILINCSRSDSKSDYTQINDVPLSLNINDLNENKSQNNDENPFGFRGDEQRSSKKLKRIIDFIY